MMKVMFRTGTVLLTWLILSASLNALPPIDGKIFGIYPIVNEVSLYRNVDDSGNDRGRTLQIISINSLKIWTEFTFEFTGDFNWDMAFSESGGYMDKDHYIELSLVKPVISHLSINYQRIYSTFEDEPINQVGLRISF